MEGCLEFIPSLFCSYLQVFPCLIPGGLQLVQLFPRLILLMMQRFDGFVVFDLRLGLGLVRPGLGDGDGDGDGDVASFAKLFAKTSLELPPGSRSEGRPGEE